MVLKKMLRQLVLELSDVPADRKCMQLREETNGLDSFTYAESLESSCCGLLRFQSLAFAAVVAAVAADIRCIAAIDDSPKKVLKMR